MIGVSIPRRHGVVSLASIVLVLLGIALPAAADWSQREKITSTPRGVGAQFGHAVAVSGNTMVVGARYDGTKASQAGAAFVYVLNGAIWTQQAKLLAGDGALADKFGASVAIDGNTIVVGAFNDDAPMANSGSAYVFVRSGTTWTQQQKLTAGDGTDADEFGNAVGARGDTVFVGAHFADLLKNPAAGAVYVFQRSGAAWTQSQKLTPIPGPFPMPPGPVPLTPPSPVLGDSFGESIAVSGDRVAIGSSMADVPETAAGAVYVYVGNGGSYALQRRSPFSTVRTATGSAFRWRWTATRWSGARPKTPRRPESRPTARPTSLPSAAGRGHRKGS